MVELIKTGIVRADEARRWVGKLFTSYCHVNLEKELLSLTYIIHVLLQMNYLNGLIKIENFLTLRIGYEESKTMYGSRWWIPIKWAIEVDGILLLKSFFPFNRCLTQQEERSL